MAFFLSIGVLIFALIYLYLNLILWRKTKSLSVLLLQGILYLYTFHGYFLVYLGGISEYVHSKMGLFYGEPYYASVDYYFYLSLFYQLIFGIVFLGVLYFFLYKKMSIKTLDKTKEMNLRRVSILVGVVLFINVYLWKNEFFGFIVNGEISYLFFKGIGGTFPWYTLSKLSLDFISMILFLSVFVVLGISKDFMERIEERKHYFPVLIFAFLGLFFLLSISLGDRLSLAIGLFFAFSLISFNKKFDKKMIFKIFTLLFVIFLLINFIRLVRTDVAKESLGESKSDVFLGIFADLIITGEAHPTFSLNAILKGDVESFEGGSLKYAFFVFVPRFIIYERPLSGYEYMAEQLGLDYFTWWGIHYSADWYLNFGVFGIIIGAILLGGIFGGVYRLALRDVGGRFVFAGMISILPLLFRNDGMANYKNFVYYGILGFLVYLVSFSNFKFFKREDFK